MIECASVRCPLSVRLAISLFGRVAADLGAHVTILGEPGDEISTDEISSIDPCIADMSALSLFLNVGKHRRAPATSDRAAVVGGLIDGADVVACDGDFHRREGQRTGEAIWAVISQGLLGEESAQSEFTTMAATGLLDLVGEPDQRPLRLGGHQLAYAAGLAAYAGVAAALGVRGAGGGPDVIRVDLAEVGVWLNWKSVVMTSWGERSATRLGKGGEWSAVRCADGWVALVFKEADWPVLREIVGDPRLFDRRLDDRLERRKDAVMINDVIQSHLGQLTRKQLRDLALKHRLPLGPVWSPAELEHDPQFLDRGFVERTPSEGRAPILRPRLPILWNGERPDVGAASPAEDAA